MPEVPDAVVEPRRRLSPVWIVPLLALILAIWLGYRAWSLRGVLIRVQLADGHGLKVGDHVRYLGTTVGSVREMRLAPDLDSVVATIAVEARAEAIARAGSRFWVVRPQLGLQEVAGLETLVGPRYLAVLPGDGPRQSVFVGLDRPPVVERVGPGDLEIVLQAPRRGGLAVGAPLLFRQVRIGTITSVGLASDGSAVEAGAHVARQYTPLITPRTRFWLVGGFDAKLGISGVELRVESVQALLGGGVALATPPDTGGPVHTGHRFDVAAEPEDEWLRWQPVIMLGSELLPPGAPRPAPLRATIGWRDGLIFRSRRSRHGWVLQTEAGLLGPHDLLRPPPEHEESVRLEVAGQVVRLPEEAAWSNGRLALIDVHVDDDRVWPMSRTRIAAAPEDALAVGDAAAAPLPLAAARLSDGEGRSWLIDPALAIDESWHGAAVLARSDGALVGMLIVPEDGPAVVALIGEMLAQP